jgi:hypothetical protein
VSIFQKWGGDREVVKENIFLQNWEILTQKSHDLNKKSIQETQNMHFEDALRSPPPVTDCF